MTNAYTNFLGTNFFPMFSNGYITAFLAREMYAHLIQNYVTDRCHLSYQITKRKKTMTSDIKK